jgi:hypothetical protein
MAAPEERQATAGAAVIIQRRVAVAAIIPVVVEVDAPTAAVATPVVAEVVDTRVVLAIPVEVVAATPVAEDMEVTAKKLGDATSLREAAT